MEKTNVMRVLDRCKVRYESHCYLSGEDFSPENAPSGVEVAAVLGIDVARVFKTLVTVSKSLNHYVFVIPVASELDLKKAASAVGEKSVEMLKFGNLLSVTGYVHGGCSPIGMKKAFTTVFDVSAKELPTVVFSAGKIGYQVELAPADLARALKFSYADLTR